MFPENKERPAACISERNILSCIVVKKANCCMRQKTQNIERVSNTMEMHAIPIYNITRIWVCKLVSFDNVTGKNLGAMFLMTDPTVRNIVVFHSVI